MRQLFPFFVWTILIFVVSSVPRLPGDVFGMPTWSDKIAHFLEYLILAFLFYRGIRGERWRMGVPAWLIVLVTGLVIASVDEYHQAFIPGRDSNVFDWTADMAGVASGTLIGMRRYRPRAGAAEQA
jgi:VanZ family protein